MLSLRDLTSCGCIAMSETMSAAQAQSTLPPVTGAEKTKGGKWKKRLTGVAKRIAQPYSGLLSYA